MLNLILGFSPFIVFSILTQLSMNMALWLAFAAAFVISIRDFVETRALKLLDMGSLVLFGLMALYTGFVQQDLSFGAVRLMVDIGLLLLVCGSLLRRQPFTLQYARETVPQELWAAPLFLRVNYIITAVWALAFVIMTIADALATFDSSFPVIVSVAVGVLSLAGALTFTLRYPIYVQRHPPS